MLQCVNSFAFFFLSVDVLKIVLKLRHEGILPRQAHFENCLPKRKAGDQVFVKTNAFDEKSDVLII